MTKGIPGRSRQPLLAGLALLFLAGTQIVLFAPPIPHPAATGQRAAVADTPKPEEAAVADTPKPEEKEWPSILARPLFAPSRRLARVSKASAPSALDGYQVLGIGVMNSTATAIVKAPSGTSVRLLPGQSLEGWTLKAIEPMRLLLEQEGQSTVIPLDLKTLRQSIDQKDDRNGRKTR